MKYLLDTNICIRHLNQKSKAITARLKATAEEDIIICSIVRAELYFGALKSKQSEDTLAKQQAFVGRFVSLSFDDAVVPFYARIRVDLESAGIPIGSNDLMIAAIALAHNLTVVTHNTREFGRVELPG